jgi:hypothetical protein
MFLEEKTMDTIFLLMAALIILVALDLGEAGARAAGPTRGRRTSA